MSKRRITQREVKATHTALIQAGAGDLQRLLRQEQPYAYTVRREGWAADVYSFGSVAIVTGYSAFGNIKPPYETRKKYDDLARAIDEGGQPWDERKRLKRELITEFITEVTK